MITSETIEQALLNNIESSQVRVLTDDNRHFAVQVVCASFQGETLVTRQRKIYTILQPWLTSGDLHAVQLETLTPDELRVLNTNG